MPRRFSTACASLFTVGLWTAVLGTSCSPGPGGGGADSPGDGAAGAPDLYRPDHVLEVELTLAPADWDTLRTQARNASNVFEGDCLDAPFENPFTHVPATIRIDGQEQPNVGVRKKGFLGSLDEEKPSLKVSFDEYGGTPLLGVKDLTLNNAKQDPSLVSQCLGYSVFAAAGVPSPRCSFARVTVNGVDLGVYVNVEPIKKPMLRRYFASDEGNLYEGTLSDFRDGWLATFDQKTNETVPDRSALERVAAALRAPDATLLADLEATIDLPGFLSFWAAEVILEHWDGYARNTNNYYVYVDPSSGKVSFLPWGTDQLFGLTEEGKRREPAPIFTVGALANRLYAHPQGRSRFESRLREILEAAWKPNDLTTEAARMEALLLPLVPSGQRGGFSAAIAATRQRISGRRAALEAILNAAPSPVTSLRDSVCFLPIGTVSGSFDTTWGTVGAADPFAAGRGTLNATVNGAPWLFTPGFVGAVAGLSDDPSSDKEVTLAVIGLRLDGKLGLFYVGLDRTDVTPGQVTLDFATTPSILLEMDPAVPNDPGRVIGLLLGGTVTFDRAGTTQGAAVTGTFDGTLFQTSLLDGN